MFGVVKHGWLTHCDCGSTGSRLGHYIFSQAVSIKIRFPGLGVEPARARVSKSAGTAKKIPSQRKPASSSSRHSAVDSYTHQIHLNDFVDGH